MSARPFEEILRKQQTPRGEGLDVNGKMVNGGAEGFISGPKLPEVR